jgi:hypothetical protein
LGPDRVVLGGVELTGPTAGAKQDVTASKDSASKDSASKDSASKDSASRETKKGRAGKATPHVPRPLH